MHNYEPCVVAAQGGKTHLVAAAQDPNESQQTCHHIPDDIQPASSPSKVPFVLLNQSPSCFQEGLRKCFEQPSAPVKDIFLSKSLFGLQSVERPNISNRTRGSCGQGPGAQFGRSVVRPSLERGKLGCSSGVEKQPASGVNSRELVRTCVGSRELRPRRHRFGAPRAKGPGSTSQPSPSQLPQRKALVIGINGKGENPLDFAVRDAKRFETCLKEQLAFEARNIIVLTDGEKKGVSQMDIFKGLRWLFRGAGSSDLLVLFISGHCSLGGNSVVALESAEPGGPRLIPSTVFKSHIDQLPKDCTVEIVLDCCYSGGLVEVPHVVEQLVCSGEGRINACFASSPGIGADMVAEEEGAAISGATPLTRPSTSSSGRSSASSLATLSVTSAAASPTSSPTSPSSISPATSPTTSPATSPSTSPEISPICSSADSPSTSYLGNRNSHDGSTAAPFSPCQSVSVPLGVSKGRDAKQRASYNVSQAPLVGPRLGEPIKTDADVTVWTACQKGEKAYESIKPRVENGVLTNAICSAIENFGALVARCNIWEEVKRATNDENAQRSDQARGPDQHLHQHPQVRSSRDDRKRIMEAPAFQRASNSAR